MPKKTMILSANKSGKSKEQTSCKPNEVAQERSSVESVYACKSRAHSSVN